jgi:asparagine synthase (glutamine-hydrolysing)
MTVSPIGDLLKYLNNNSHLVLRQKVILNELEISRKLKGILNDSVVRNSSENLLLSGGLDSSIVCSISRPKKTVTIASSVNAPDVSYAKLVASKYSKQHTQIILKFDQLLEVIDSVIHILKTFDPIEIRNSSVLLAAIEHVKIDGGKSIMTGDGADELFAGYNYLLRYYDDLIKLDKELKRLWKIMSFSSTRIGKKMGIEVMTPFLDNELVTFAESLDVNSKIGLRNGRIWGKYILRKCYESDLGVNIAWRIKYAQEQGSGFAAIRNILLKRCKYMDSANAVDKSKQGARIRDMEQLYYFEIYRKYFPLPIEEPCAGERCPDCHACLRDNSNSNYCHTCGCFPTNRITRTI